MSLGRSIRILFAGRRLATLAAAGWLAAACFAQDSVPIRFSKPFEPILTTNLNSLFNSKQKSFQELLKEADSHSVSGIFKDDLPIGLMPAPARPRMSPAAAQKYRDAADKKKNWAFTIENDVQNDPKIGRLMKFLDDDAKAESDRQRSVYEKFYERLEREDKGSDVDGPFDPLNPNQSGAGPDDPLASSDPGSFGALNLPGSDSPFSSVSSGDALKASGAKPRDVLGLAQQRNSLSTATTRQATDFTDYQRGSLAGGLSTPAQQARFDAFKNMLDSKPSSGSAAAAAAASKASSSFSTALGGLGLPSSSSGAAAAATASRSSFADRLDSTPAWKPSTPVSTPMPPIGGGVFPTTPSRNGTLFPTVPTRRQ